MTFENKLPSGYTTGTIDLDGDKKLSLRLYAAAAAVAVVLTVVCCLLKDISLLFDASGVFALLGRFVLIMLITAFCLVGQEHLKCIIIGKLTGKPARVVRGRMSAYIEYKCWLDKRSYLIMSLAPAAAVCLVLLILMIILPISCSGSAMPYSSSASPARAATHMLRTGFARKSRMCA